MDAIGECVSEVKPGDRVGALTVIGGYTEVLYWRADRLIPVPATIDPARAVPLILNYIVAYQTMHRKALVKAGDTVLLQLGRLTGLKMYAVASKGSTPSWTA